jgi:hypothetical protein
MLEDFIWSEDLENTTCKPIFLWCIKYLAIFSSDLQGYDVAFSAEKQSLKKEKSRDRLHTL